MTTTHAEHQQDHGHHEPPEVVDGRQRLAIWLFIGGDVVGLAALSFTYLYLRGTNTGGHWLNVLGYASNGHSSDWFQNQINNNPNFAAPTLQHESPLTAGLTWLITLVVVAAAAVLWAGEGRLKKVATGHKSYATFALVATLAIVAATIFQIIQVRHVPEYFYWKNDAQLFVYTGYGSGILALGISSVIHFIITALLGIGLTIRASRGVITQTKWYQARLVRYFFVWMAVSSVVSSIIMTSFH